VKTCTKCGQSLSEDQFHKRTYKSGKVGLQPKCKKCASIERRKYTVKHETIRWKLGLTKEDVERLTASGECANTACRSKDRRLCIDHCHDTKKPRGLLCHNCNTALGLLGDNVQVILGLSQYLAQLKQLALLPLLLNPEESCVHCAHEELLAQDQHG